MEKKLSIWKRPIDLNMFQEIDRKSMSTFLDIKLTEIGDDYIVGEMPVSDKIRQPFGLVHGGAYVVLAETLGSFASNFCIDQKHYAVGLDINANHVHAIKKGIVSARATAKQIGSTIHVWSIECQDKESKRLLSIARLTTIVRKAK